MQLANRAMTLQPCAHSCASASVIFASIHSADAPIMFRSLPLCSLPCAHAQCITFFLFSVSSPSLLLVAVISAATLLFLFPSPTSGRDVVISGRSVSLSERRVIATVAVLLLMCATGAAARLLYAAALCALACLAHAIFRPRNIRSKATRMGEDARAVAGMNLSALLHGDGPLAGLASRRTSASAHK